MSGFKIAKGVHDQGAFRFQNAAHSGEGFLRHAMRGTGITQERIENHRVIAIGGLVHKIATIPEMDVQLLRLKSEVIPGHRHDGRVDLDHIHFGVFTRESHWHDADAQADAEDAIDVGRVGPRQIVEHVSEHGRALL